MRFVLSLLLPAFVLAHRFSPPSDPLPADAYTSNLPTRYGIADSQSIIRADEGYGNSYWSSSYLTGCDGQEYLLVSHVLKFIAFDIYRASLTGISDPSIWHQFSTQVDRVVTADLDFEYAEYAFGLANTADKLGPTNTWSTVPELGFNITFDVAGPVILNGGIGVFDWPNSTLVNEWSAPAGLTTGSLTLPDSNTPIEIDPTKSSTWYDRQWQLGSATTWTWFQLHLSSGEKMSIWFYTNLDGTQKGFASVKNPVGSAAIQSVIPATLKPSGKTWTSPYGSVYDLEWTLNLDIGGKGMELQIKTTRDDQELTTPDGSFRTYEGWIEVSGDREGFGLVEMQFAEIVL